MGQYSVKRTVYKQADDFLQTGFFYKPMGGKETAKRPLPFCDYKSPDRAIKQGNYAQKLRQATQGAF